MPYTRRVSICLMGGAALAGPALAAGSADGIFAGIVHRWLEGYLSLQPVTATQTGDHRFDAELDDMSPAGRAARVALWRKLAGEIAALDRKSLSRDNQVDAAILKNALDYAVWDDQSLQSWAWDAYSWSQLIGDALYVLMAREFAPLPARLKSATARMKKLPALMAQMRAGLVVARVPAIHATTAAQQNSGVMEVVDSMILPEIKALAAADQAEIKAAADALRKAAAEHQHWLDKTLVPGAKGDFRIGPKLFDQKLAFTLMSDLSRKDIRARAEAAHRQVRGEMYAIAQKVLAGKIAAPDHPDAATEQRVIQAALELAYADKPAPDRLVETSREALAQATAFVRQKDLITLPDAPVQVIVMPKFAQGVAVAYCDPPGPLDKGQATFYAVSPIPDGWTKAQADSFLREYNRRGIADIAVHEAMPGHYVQLWHSNTCPSLVRGVLGSGSFVEGWAVYAENVMAMEGFYHADPLYRLVQLKVWLRSITNSILDQEIHCDGISEKDAMTLMVDGAFQEEREAAGKWTRARLSSTQLSTYFVGRQEHDGLRTRAEKQDGFNLKAYHDKVLSYGSPPARYAGALMFGDAII